MEYRVDIKKIPQVIPVNEEVLLTEGAKANTGRVINHSNLEGSQEVQRHKSTFIMVFSRLAPIQERLGGSPLNYQT